MEGNGQLSVEDAPPPPPPGRARHNHPLSHYTGIFNARERTLKLWNKKGKESAPVDLPPLDDPESMPDWWSRHMVQSVPESLMLAAARARDAREKATAAVTSQSPPPAKGGESPPVELPPRDFSQIAARDIAGNVEVLRKNLAIAAYLLEEALKGRNESLITMRQNVYKSCFDLLRKAENDLIDHQKKLEELIPRKLVLEENRRIASAIHGAVLRVQKKIFPRCHGKSEQEQDKIWKEAISDAFRVLKTSRFTAEIVLEDAA